MTTGDRRSFLGRAGLSVGGLFTYARSASAQSGPGHDGPLPPGTFKGTPETGSAAALPEFRYALDRSEPTVASGGRAFEVSARQFPISKSMSAVHMFIEPGAARELHWHAAAGEWAYVIDGQCQTVVLTPEGTSEINNFGPGDLWFFPQGHGHSIQTIGDKACHFLLSFNDGDTSPEHETFNITDWMSVTPPDWLARDFDMPAELFETFPKKDVYIQAGSVLAPSSALDAPWPKDSTHRFRLTRDPRAEREFGGGTFRVATTDEWPVSKPMSGGLMTIRPGAMRRLHWNPNANEMHYYLRGQGEVALFGSRGRGRVAAFGPGDVAYIPRGFGHAIRNTGSEDLVMVQTWDAGRLEEIELGTWIRSSPNYLLANNFAGVPRAIIDRLKRG